MPRQIPVRIIAQILGIDEAMSDQFTTWVRGVLELGLQDPVLRAKSRDELFAFFLAEIADRRANPRDDLISELLAAEVDGQPVPDHHILGTCGLLLIAGIDTTWSSIGSSIWHLATHPEDRQRLSPRARADPDGDRGVPPRLLARDDGAHRERGNRNAGRVHARRRPRDPQLPVRQPRSGTRSPTPTR